MKKNILILFISCYAVLFAQEITPFPNSKNLAHFQVKELKGEGALVLRLLLHKKNAELYRKVGQHKRADRIERNLKNRNLVLAKVVLDSSFDFCNGYIIEAKNYQKLISGGKFAYVLNENLALESSIILATEKLYFMDVASVYVVIKEKINEIEKNYIWIQPYCTRCFSNQRSKFKPVRKSFSLLCKNKCFKCEYKRSEKCIGQAPIFGIPFYK